MWVYMRNAFLSIVAHQDRPRRVLVRARLPGDIQSVFPGAVVNETPDADYRFQAVLLRTEVSDALRANVEQIDYDNLLDSVVMGSRYQAIRYPAYYSAWTAMTGAQYWLQEVGEPVDEESA